MMFDVCNLGGARQELVEVAAPSGRVQPVAISSRRGPIQYVLRPRSRVAVSVFSVQIGSRLSRWPRSIAPFLLRSPAQQPSDLPRSRSHDPISDRRSLHPVRRCSIRWFRCSCQSPWAEQFHRHDHRLQGNHYRYRDEWISGLTSGLPGVVEGRRCDWDHSTSCATMRLHQRRPTPSRVETIQCAKIIPSETSSATLSLR